VGHGLCSSSRRSRVGGAARLDLHYFFLSAGTDSRIPSDIQKGIFHRRLEPHEEAEYRFACRSSLWLDAARPPLTTPTNLRLACRARNRLLQRSTSRAPSYSPKSAFRRLTASRSTAQTGRGDSFTKPTTSTTTARSCVDKAASRKVTTQNCTIAWPARMATPRRARLEAFDVASRALPAQVDGESDVDIDQSSPIESVAPDFSAGSQITNKDFWSDADRFRNGACGGCVGFEGTRQGFGEPSSWPTCVATPEMCMFYGAGVSTVARKSRNFDVWVENCQPG
jgi:hypothetical protein